MVKNNMEFIKQFDPEIGDAIRDTAYIKVANTTDGVWEFAAVQGVE